MTVRITEVWSRARKTWRYDDISRDCGKFSRHPAFGQRLGCVELEKAASINYQLSPKPVAIKTQPDPLAVGVVALGCAQSAPTTENKSR